MSTVLLERSEINDFLNCMHNDVGADVYQTTKDNLPRAYFVKDFQILPIEVGYDPPQIFYRNNGEENNEQLVFRCLKRRRIQQER
jgi:hypothetical protein